jgi:RNA methyltransferase, RsmE family
MQQYFVNQTLSLKTTIELNQEQTHHITKVLRMKVHNQILLSDTQSVFLAEILSLHPVISALCVEEVVCDSEFEKPIYLACALIKGDHWDMMLQKATELGVTEIIPVYTKHCVVKPNDKIEKKVSRWQKIAIEAAEQSHRRTFPLIRDAISLKELSDIDVDLKLVAYEKEGILLQELDLRQKSVLIVIGPEGGFAKEEINLLENKGFITVSLGNRILRAETAAIYCLSAFGVLLK